MACRDRRLLKQIGYAPAYAGCVGSDRCPVCDGRATAISRFTIYALHVRKFAVSWQRARLVAVWMLRTYSRMLRLQVASLACSALHTWHAGIPAKIDAYAPAYAGLRW